MNSGDFVVGVNLIHRIFGEGQVTQVDDERVTMIFSDGRSRLLDKVILASLIISSVDELRPSLSEGWPESTFLDEAASAKHFMGSHWQPFVDDVNEILEQLPDMIPQLLDQVGYGSNRIAPVSIPADWPRGMLATWPLRPYGLAMVLAPSPEENQIISLFPFYGIGSQHGMCLEHVTRWSGGLEGQITATLGEAVITFFDTAFVLNRDWYFADKHYQFILTGLAYSAEPVRQETLAVNLPSTVSSAINNIEGVPDFPSTLNLKGMAALLPMDQGDIDDYWYRGTIISVKVIDDLLSQPTWDLRIVLLRTDSEEIEITVVVTQRVWTLSTPPQVGQDIEGQLWLQGHLWDAGSL